MALLPESYQYLSQMGVQRLIDASTGPEGSRGVTAHWLVPTGEWHNGQRLQFNFVEDLKKQKFDKTMVEGVEYFLVPEESSNLPGRIAHYAQTTGVAELQNPPGGGVNRVRETLLNTAEATVAPDAVAKYVEENDAFEEERKRKSALDEQLASAVADSPAREGSEGKLVKVEADKKATKENLSSPASLGKPEAKKGS